MTKKELLDIARQRGFNVPPATLKAEILDLLR
jgi:hypothetical protein